MKKRFEFSIYVPDGFEIDDESMDNIKSYLCYCFKVGKIEVNSWGLPDWLVELHSTDPEIPF